VVVIDASIALELFLDTPRGKRAANQVFDQERHAPPLIDLEFTQALRRLTLAREIAAERARLVLDIFGDWAITRHGHTPFLRRIWELRSSVSAYDAAYVALAEGLQAPLLTCDGRLARSHGHSAEIVLV
jgi:predicted nucleic acid-binding protein